MESTPVSIARSPKKSQLLSGVAEKRLPAVLAAAILFIAVAVAYSNSFRGPFIYDDPIALLGNESIQSLWPPWHALVPPPKTSVSGRPIANLSFAMSYRVSGYEVWSYHAFNLLIHAAATLALFGVVRRILLSPVLRPRFGRDALTASFAVAALWGLHPIQTEAVTYIIQRVESLMGLFFLLTLYGFVRAAGSMRPGRWEAVAVVACLFGAGTKEVTACAPVIVLLCDRTFFAGSFTQAWRLRKRLHALLFSTWIPLAGFVASTGWNRNGSAGLDVGVHPWAYWLTQFEAITTYLKLTFWPTPLVFEYGTFWVRPMQALPHAMVVLPLACLSLWALCRRPAWGFLGFWFFGILAPTSLMPGTFQMIVEHRMYLSLAAVVAAVVAGMYVLVGRRSFLLWAVAAPILGVMTYTRNAVYRTESSLWADCVAKRPGNDRAQNNLGNAYYHEGRLAEAIEHYGAAARLTPTYAEAHSNLCNAYLQVGRAAAAILEGRIAVLLQPTYAHAHGNLGNALLATQKIDEGIGELTAAARLAPRDPQPVIVLGDALAAAGRFKEAIGVLKEGSLALPGNPNIIYELGNAYLRADRPDTAIAYYQDALRMQPNNTNAWNNLGNAFLSQGRVPEATAAFQSAVNHAPAEAIGHNNLGAALSRAGQLDKAISEFETALFLKPDYPDARRNLESVRNTRAQK